MPPLAVDTHVHLHPGVDPDAWLTHAVNNATRAMPDAAGLVLCLTERAGVHRFAELLSRPDATPAGGNSGGDTAGVTLRPNAADGFPVMVLPGRQVVTAQRIEVLLLGLVGDPVPDGGATDALLRDPPPGCLPVLPYGVGKWLGRRGRTVAGYPAVAKADIVGRVRVPGLRRPRPLRGRVLRGTDPLPIPGDEAVTARFGNRVELDPKRADWPEALLAALRDRPKGYGRHLTPVAAVRRQVALRRSRA